MFIKFDYNKLDTACHLLLIFSDWTNIHLYPNQVFKL